MGDKIKLKFYSPNDCKKKNKMSIHWFSTGKTEQGFCLIGKTGTFRFKQAFAEIMKFQKGERWLIGVDSKEKPTYIIFVRADGENKINGFKMIFQNKSWALSAKTVIKELGLSIPQKCKTELYKDEKYEGFKIVLSKFAHQ